MARKRKALRAFIKENREAIDKAIERALGHDDFRHNDGERRMWIMNDYGLYQWARGEGVNI